MYDFLSTSEKVYQLIKLINDTRNTNRKILEKIDQKSHTLKEFSFNVTQIYLQNYNFVCILQNCSTCNLYNLDICLNLIFSFMLRITVICKYLSRCITI